jgi:class 3 adenylate cyclase
MTHTDLLQQLASLAEGFSRLGARASQAARELQESGVPPAESLLEEFTAASRDFADLRAKVFDLAASAAVAAEETASVKDLEALLRDVAQAIEKAQAEEARQRAIAVLDRVLALAHRDESSYAPLLDCQAKAGDLRRAIAEAAWQELPEDTQPLADGSHPLAALLTLVERAEELTDAQWEPLSDVVSTAFGKTLVGAAWRRKLASRTEIPPAPPPTPAPPPKEEPIETPVQEVLAAPSATAVQEVVAAPAPPPAETPEEVTVAAETPAAAPAPAPVEEKPSQVTVVYLELRGYSEFAETYKLEIVKPVLNEYLSEMGKLILSHQGSLEHITGDGMVIAFKDPIENQAERAVRMALQIRDRISEMITKWRKRGFKLNFCAGIEQGLVTPEAGDEGTLETASNQASALCREGKFGQILISETFLEGVMGIVEVEAVGKAPPQAGGSPLPTYNIVRPKG